LVSVAPIQKIIGIGCLTSADTINHIFYIDCTMSADTNNVSGIRGVPCRRETLITVIFFCAIMLPNFPALYAATSLDTASLDTTSSPSPSSTPPSALTPHRRQPRRTIAIAVPDPLPTPSRRAVTNPIAPSPSPFLTRRHPHRVALSPSPFPRLEPRHQAGASPVSIG
jgi:hypothetical protein